MKFIESLFSRNAVAHTKYRKYDVQTRVSLLPRIIRNLHSNVGNYFTLFLSLSHARARARDSRRENDSRARSMSTSPRLIDRTRKFSNLALLRLDINIENLSTRGIFCPPSVLPATSRIDEHKSISELGREKVCRILSF